jgi:hypothetical protein
MPLFQKQLPDEPKNFFSVDRNIFGEENITAEEDFSKANCASGLFQNHLKKTFGMTFPADAIFSRTVAEI